MNRTLPTAVYFVVSQSDRWRDLIEADPASAIVPSVEELHDRIATNEDCWIVSTYLQLRAKVSNVYLTTRPQAGQLCVVSGLDFRIRDASIECFFVGARSDGPDPTLCQLRVVQNQSQSGAPASHYLPHWPQPALLPRSADRGDLIETIVFHGHEANLDERFRTATFARELQRLGVRLHVSGRDSSERVAWNDYRACDLVLAARNLTERDAFTKPASKLVNAWLAGVPAMLGPEPAFQHLRRDELDFFEVNGTADVLRVVERLQRDPRRYRAAIRQGRQRGEEFASEKIADRWIDFLSGPAAEEFDRWTRTGTVQRAARLLAGVIGHKRAKAQALYHREHGHRILDDLRAPAS